MNKRKLEHHGMRSAPEYQVWRGMKLRCHSPTHIRFCDYGGRGICVCDEWRTSFSTFFRDMGPRPSPDHQIDRIDNSRGYEPGNCRWVTRLENMRNRRPRYLCGTCGAPGHGARACPTLSTGEKTCKRCLQTKPIARFSPRAKSIDGREHTCRECRIMAQRCANVESAR